MMSLELKDSKGKVVERWFLKDREEKGDEELEECSGVIYPTFRDSFKDFQDMIATIREVYPMYRG